MCNRYRMTAKELELAAAFGVDVSKLLPEEQIPPPELFPKRIGWVVRQEGGQRVLDAMQWGVPLQMKGAKGQPITKQVTNVRNLSSPFWKGTIGKTDFRCLVPVTDFCEWEGEAGAKQERWFFLPSAPIFAFAGVWRSPDPQRRPKAVTLDRLPVGASEVVQVPAPPQLGTSASGARSGCIGHVALLSAVQTGPAVRLRSRRHTGDPAIVETFSLDDLVKVDSSFLTLDPGDLAKGLSHPAPQADERSLSGESIALNERCVRGEIAHYDRVPGCRRLQNG